MITHEGVDTNFRFMVIEVTKQFEKTLQAIEDPSSTSVSKIISRDNYIDILKSIIGKKCISFYRQTPSLDKQSADLASAISTVTSNLERIADFCNNVLSKLRKFSDRDFIKRFDYRAYFAVINQALPMVSEGLLQRDTTTALQLCEAETQLNDLYEADFDRIRGMLREGGDDTDDLLISLHILHYLERVGDSLLNIGEAILFAATGEKLKIHQYLVLDESLQASSGSTKIEDCHIRCDYETRSGSRIGRVQERTEDQDLEAIFKEGNQDKLLRERENIKRWEQTIPGLPPRVLDYRQTDRDAALLLEFIDGLTFQDIILSADDEAIQRVLTRIQATLTDAWDKTMCFEARPPSFVDQLRKRVEDVFRVHPEFNSTSSQIGTIAVGSLSELLESAGRIEQELMAPFQMLIHGDFNTDNVIYDQRQDRIHFIDLHRSTVGDYAQDISVFLVSNFRMPVFDSDVRDRLNDVNCNFFEFALSFARAHDDECFEPRLALGLARSFLTSTRFELNKEFAKTMYMRSMYLMDKVIQHAGRPWDTFRLASETLTY